MVSKLNFKIIKSILISILFIVTSCSKKQEVTLFYPEFSNISTTVDTFYGMKVPDPYRNLENLNDSTVIEWFHHQNNLTSEYLNKIKGRKQFLTQALQISNKEKTTKEQLSINKNGVFFYLKTDPSKNSNTLYMKESEDADEIPLYSSASFGENYLINYYTFNSNSTKAVISLSKKGEDASILSIYDATTQKISDHTITNASPSLVGDITWLPDNHRFIYLEIPHFDYQDKSYLTHTQSMLYDTNSKNTRGTVIFGTQKNTALDINKEDFPFVQINQDTKKYIIGSIDKGFGYKDVYIESIANVSNPNWKLLFTKDQKITRFRIAGDQLIYLTSINGSNFSICATSLLNPNFESPDVLVKEKKDEVIRTYEVVNDALYYTTVKNGVHASFYKYKKGEEKKIALPYTSGSSNLSLQNNELYISIIGWTKPFTLYKYDTVEETFEYAMLDKLSFPNFENFIVKEIEVPTKDGIHIPVSIIHSENITLDGTNPTIMLSYGAYGASMTPFFYTPFMLWVEQGGIWVIPHVRGGGEKGDAWYKAGYKTTKPNTWNDVITTAEYLIENNYTSPDYLVNMGSSAGGIAAGRSLTERPDLFKVGILDVPSLNLVRSEEQPYGLNSIKEFGTVKDSIEFFALYEMDSYHHIKEGVAYPAIIVNTGMKDGLVTPWDPAKFVARIQQATTSNNPILFTVDFNAGHSGDGTMQKYYDDITKLLSFAFWQTGHPDYQLE